MFPTSVEYCATNLTLNQFKINIDMHICPLYLGPPVICPYWQNTLDTKKRSRDKTSHLLRNRDFHPDNYSIPSNVSMMTDVRYSEAISFSNKSDIRSAAASAAATTSSPLFS